MGKRIAVASSDGENIDLHFAQAYQFDIYEIEETESRFVERRSGIRISFHDEQAFEQVLSMLHDCMAVFVSRIGYGAARYVFARGMRVFEAPFPVQAVLSKVINKRILD